jgi:hypothetical protein
MREQSGLDFRRQGSQKVILLGVWFDGQSGVPLSKVVKRKLFVAWIQCDSALKKYG